MKARCTKCSTIFEATPDDEGVLFCASCGHRMRVKKPGGEGGGKESKATDEVPAPSTGKAGGGSNLPAVMKANKVVAGKDCPGCKEKIDLGVEVHNCETCGASHHAKCWDDLGKCQSADCPSRLKPKKASSEGAADEGGDTQPCKFCGEAIKVGARKCRHCGEYQNQRDRAAASAAAGNDIQTYLVPAILCTLFCCCPAGIVSIVYAAQVSSKIKAGDIPGAKQASANAKTWVTVSFVLGLIGGVLRIAMVMSEAGRHGGY